MRTLVAIPVYNEQKYVASVLEKVRQHAEHILVIDDGSKDATPQLLANFPVEVIRHSTNRGYGHSLLDAFRWAAVDGFDWVITMDCDEQHEPASIPAFLRAAREGRSDIVSGSRYLIPPEQQEAIGSPPPERRAVNTMITEELNSRLGLALTDAFCGFKAYRVSALAGLSLDEQGYAFPLQFWVQAVAAGLRIEEIPIKLIYNDLTRSFGGPLDDRDVRLAHYRRVLHCELKRCAGRLPISAIENVTVDCSGS